MKIQNIFALIVTLVGFAACTSESELPNTPENGELVPVTINLGSLQTKSVDLAEAEGTIQNAVVAIFDSKGIPTVAPLVLSGSTSSETRLPLIRSNAYAFVNVSQEDIDALTAISNEAEFKAYQIKKELSQNAVSLPKYGELTGFIPEASISIEVKQLTARVEVMVDVKVIKDRVEISNEGFSFAKNSVSWNNMNFNNNELTSTDGINPVSGYFTTTINGRTYNTLNRAYSYPGATPTISLEGIVSAEGFSGVNSNLSYTFAKELVKDNVYVVRFVVTVDMSTPVTPTISYEVLAMETVSIDVPAFN